MKNSIIFPFFYQNENRQRYLKTLQLAKEKDAEVVLFTSLPNEAGEEEIDKVYLHLLELNGFYQTTHNNWGTSKIKFRRVIKKGDMRSNLQTYLEKLSIPSHLIVE